MKSEIPIRNPKSTIRNLPEEIAQHVEDRYNDLRARGQSDADARAEAMSEIDEELSRELAALAPPPSMWADVVPDTHYTLRGLRRNPIFAIVIIVTLGFGIGANSAIFSIVNAVVLRPLPYDKDGRLVVVWGDLNRPGVNEIPGSPDLSIIATAVTHSIALPPTTPMDSISPAMETPNV